MKTTMTLAAAAAAAAFLAACGDDGVSFETLETQRAVANDNSRYNAQKWRAENGHEQFGILARGSMGRDHRCWRAAVGAPFEQMVGRLPDEDTKGGV